MNCFSVVLEYCIMCCKRDLNFFAVSFLPCRWHVRGKVCASITSPIPSSSVCWTLSFYGTMVATLSSRLILSSTREGCNCWGRIHVGGHGSSYFTRCDEEDEYSYYVGNDNDMSCFWSFTWVMDDKLTAMDQNWAPTWWLSTPNACNYGAVGSCPKRSEVKCVLLWGSSIESKHASTCCGSRICFSGCFVVEMLIMERTTAIAKMYVVQSV